MGIQHFNPMRVITLPYNPLEENTYILADDAGTCAIVDPGCYTPDEQKHLEAVIRQEKLNPVACICTHAHFDHVFGTAFVERAFGLKPWVHRLEEPGLQNLATYASFFRLKAEPAPAPAGYLEPGTPFQVGQLRLEVLFTPGHSVGHVCFWHPESRQLIDGDVLFAGSIGRTDLPGGDYATLMHSIFQVVLPLGNDVILHPGHGPQTTIGREARHNPFLKG